LSVQEAIRQSFGEVRIYSPKIVMGDVGSGKTTLLTFLGIKELEKGRKVYANYDLTDEFKNQYPELARNWIYVENVARLFLDRLIIAQGYDYVPYQDLLLIDEASGLWEARGSGGNEVENLMSELIRLHRKLGFEMLTDVQLKSMVDLRLRSLAQMFVLAIHHSNNSFEYQRWAVHPVSMKYIKLPTKTMSAHLAEQVIQYFVSTRPTSTDFASLIPELRAYLGESVEERIAKRELANDMVANFAVYGYLARHVQKRISVQVLARVQPIDAWKMSKVRTCLIWLDDNKLLMRRRR